jgi:hypothetical protein
MVGNRRCTILELETSSRKTTCETVLTGRDRQLTSRAESRLVPYAIGHWREGQIGPSCREEGGNGHMVASVRGPREWAT